MAKEKCFIIAPISTSPERISLYLNDDVHCEHVVDHLLAPAVDRAGFEPIKPKAKGANLIHAEIVQNLQTASLVLCDMSGLNPNVFFELGIRTAMNKPICLAIDEATKEPPFDLDLVNHHRYVSDLRPWILPGEVEKLAIHIKESATNKENALWKYFSLRVKADTTERHGPVDKFDLLLSEVSALRKQIGDANMSVPPEPVYARDWTEPAKVRRLVPPPAELYREAILMDAKRRGIDVREDQIRGENGIALFVAPAADKDAIEDLKKSAARVGVSLKMYGVAWPSLDTEIESLARRSGDQRPETP